VEEKAQNDAAFARTYLEDDNNIKGKGLKYKDIWLSGYERITALVFHTYYALLVQSVEFGSYEPTVTGSNPVRSIFLLLFLCIKLKY
jgi:hypothetical protein